jgi:hypothetical protein
MNHPANDRINAPKPVADVGPWKLRRDVGNDIFKTEDVLLPVLDECAQLENEQRMILVLDPVLDTPTEHWEILRVQSTELGEKGCFVFRAIVSGIIDTCIEFEGNVRLRVGVKRLVNLRIPPHPNKS